MHRERSNWWTRTSRYNIILNVHKYANNVHMNTIYSSRSVFEYSSVFTQASRPALPLTRTPSSGPPSTIAPPNNETALMTQEDLMVAMATNVASLTSRTSMGVVIVGGVVCCFPKLFSCSFAKYNFFLRDEFPSFRCPFCFKFQTQRMQNMPLQTVPVNELFLSQAGQGAYPASIYAFIF